MNVQNNQIVDSLRQQYAMLPLLRSAPLTAYNKAGCSVASLYVDGGGIVESLLVEIELTFNRVLSTTTIETLNKLEYDTLFGALLDNVQLKYNGKTLINASGVTIERLARNYGVHPVKAKSGFVVSNSGVTPAFSTLNRASKYNRPLHDFSISPDVKIKTLMLIPVAELIPNSYTGAIYLESDVDTIELQLKFATLEQLIANQETTNFPSHCLLTNGEFEEFENAQYNVKVIKQYKTTIQQPLPEFNIRYQISEDETLLSSSGKYLHKLPTGNLYKSVTHEILDGVAIPNVLIDKIDTSELFVNVIRQTASNVPIDEASGYMLRERHVDRIATPLSCHIINLNAYDRQTAQNSVIAGNENLSVEYNCSGLTAPKLKIAYERLSGG